MRLKRILSILLTLTLAITILPMQVLAETKNEAYAVLDGNGTLAFYYDNNRPEGAYDIPNLVGVENIVYSSWNGVRSQIKKVIFSSDFKSYKPTSIRYWFTDCYKLTSVEGTNNIDVSEVTNMFSLFSNCNQLTSLDLSSWDTSNVGNMEYMFNGCSSLNTLLLSSNFNTSKVTVFNGMFQNCTSLTRLDSLNFDTSNAKEITSMFYGCSNLNYLDISTFDLSGVNYAGSLFAGCAKLSTLIFPSTLNTSNLHYANSMFDGCSSFTSLDLSSWDMSHIFDWSKMFQNCTSLKTLTLPNQNTIIASDMHCMFKGCSSLEQLDLSVFDTSSVSDFREVFAGCTNLKSIDVTKFNTAKATNMISMFEDCESLTSLDLSSFNTEKLLANVNYDYGIHPAGIYKMFSGCKNLTTIWVSDNWLSTNVVKNSTNVFDNCISLKGENGTEYTSSHTDGTYAVTDMAKDVNLPGYMSYVDMREAYAILDTSTNTLTFFYDASKPASTTNTKVYDVPKTVSNYNNIPWYIDRAYIYKVAFDESFVNYRPTTTSNWFNGCGVLTSISGMQYLNTSMVTDMSKMFMYCFNLKEIDLSNFNTNEVEYMNNIFDSCYRLTELDLSSFNTTKVKNMRSMFTGCSGLKYLDLTSFDTSSLQPREQTGFEMGIYAIFSGCSKLESIYVSDKWQLSDTLVSTSNEMFKDCNSLVGEYGTTLNDCNKNNATIAVVDNGPDSTQPGLLSTGKPYAYYTEANNTLTFTYDKNRERNSEIVFDIPDENTFRNEGLPWFTITDNITCVNFTPAFSKFTPESTAYWFENFTELTDIIDLPYLNTSKVTSMCCMFNNCTSLEELDCSKFDTSSLNNMSGMFASCESLDSIILPEISSDSPLNLAGLFSNCASLADINLEVFTDKEIIDMSGMFMNCSHIEEIDLTGFDTSKLISEDSLGLPAGIHKMFTGCSSLHTIYVDENWDTTAVNDASDNTFGGCTYLTGGNGTTLSTDCISGEYAVIDSSIASGYLTLKKDFTISYLIGDDAEGTIPESISAQPKTMIILPSSSSFSRNGYDFAGWSCDNGKTILASGTEYIIGQDGDIEFVAQWEKIPTYEVSYTGGEDATGTAPATNEYYENDSITLPACTFSKDGYKFTGWSCDNGKTILFVNDEYTIGTSNIVFVAQWEQLPPATPTPTIDPTPTPTTEPTPTIDPTPTPTAEPTPTIDPTPTPTAEPTPTVNPTPTVEPTPTMEPELDIGAFVNRCYEVALGREADKAGYDYWVDSLNNGQACGTQVGYGFIFSDEYSNKNTTNEQYVRDLYSMYFDREPDEEGYNYWFNMLENGVDRKDVFAGFANSTEFFNLCGKYAVVSGTYVVNVPNEQQGGVNCFVARLYKVCLNRLPDQGGQAGWVLKLINGEVNGTTCAYGFVFSPEFIGKNPTNEEFVNYMYAAFFGREADEAGFNAWVATLNNGGSYEDVFNGFTGSQEFANLCASYGIMPK